MRRLMHQAEEFLAGKPFTPLTFLTRDKDAAYFDEILRRHHGLMATYVKDRDGNPLKPYGNPRSPINAGMHGLFFSAKVGPGGKGGTQGA
jgi:hypothetical protein